MRKKFFYSPIKVFYVKSLDVCILAVFLLLWIFGYGKLDFQLHSGRKKVRSKKTWHKTVSSEHADISWKILIFLFLYKRHKTLST